MCEKCKKKKIQQRNNKGLRKRIIIIKVILLFSPPSLGLVYNMNFMDILFPMFLNETNQRK